VLRDNVVVKGLSCVEEIQLGRHLINLVEALSSVGKKGKLLLLAKEVEESNLPDYLLDLMSQQ
jgi:hypothetical protein